MSWCHGDGGDDECGGDVCGDNDYGGDGDTYDIATNDCLLYLI